MPGKVNGSFEMRMAEQLSHGEQRAQPEERAERFRL